MTTHNLKVHDPLTVIAIFSMLTEASAAVSLPYIHSENQGIYVWFLIVFPSFLVTLFFLTLNFNNKTLYSPTHAAPRTDAHSLSHSAQHSALFSASGIKLCTYPPKRFIYLPQGHRNHDLASFKMLKPDSSGLMHSKAPTAKNQTVTYRNLHIIDLNHASFRMTSTNTLKEALQAYSKKTHKHKRVFHRHDVVLLLTHTRSGTDFPSKKRLITPHKNELPFGHATVMIYNTLTHQLSPLTG